MFKMKGLGSKCVMCGLVVAAVAVCSQSATALPVEYGVVHDPTAQTTTFVNSAMSAEPLITWSVLEASPVVNAIPPGSSGVYQADGTYVGGTTGTWTVPSNACSRHVKSTTGSAQWSNNRLGPWTNVVVCQHTVQPCNWYKIVNGSIGIGKQADCTIMSTISTGGTRRVHAQTGNSNLVDASCWPGGDIYLEVDDDLGLGVTELAIATDSDFFLSFLTPQAGTGCWVPEPTSLLLLALGVGGLATRRRK